MEAIYRGAESIVYVSVFDGQKVLVKERIKKGYRIREIDLRLRKLRTREEIKLLTEARKCGVATPQIIHVDEKEFKILMEFVEGARVKEFLNDSDKGEAKKACREIGKSAGKLHSHDIIHGDLTTSNMMIKDGRLYFIDFGLGGFSKRTEDKAVDMNLLYGSFRSTHFKILESSWNEIVNGYREEYNKVDAVLEQIKKIEGRGRYARRWRV